MGDMPTRQDHPVTTPRLGRYEIDPARSTLTFRTRHLFGLAPVRGTFTIRGGTIDVAEPLGASAVHAEIEAASFRAGNAQRNASIRSPRVLDPARHPVIAFDSERYGSAEILGTLTVVGVARPVRLLVTGLTVAPGVFTARATTRIDRTEFGVTAYRGLAGRYLDMSVEVQCLRTS
jgi:polyisoprenoid-binding protein YceI